MHIRMLAIATPLLASLLSLFACVSTQEGGPDAQGLPDARPADAGTDAVDVRSSDTSIGPDSGGSDGGDAAASDPTPVTDRASSNTHRCQVMRGRTDHSPRQWSGRQALITTRGGTAYLARLESLSPNPMFPDLPGRGTLLVSSLGTDGSFGPPVTISSAEPDTIGGVTLAASGNGFVAVWTEGAALRMAAFDAEGKLNAPAQTIAVPGIGLESRPKIAAAPDGGFGLVYGVHTEGRAPEVHFVALDGSGRPRSGARLLGTGVSSFADPATAIAADNDGYAILWRGPSGTAGRIEFAKADLTGVERIAPRTISTPPPPLVMVGGGAGFDPATTSIVPVEGGYLAAWTESRWDPNSFMSSAWSIVRLARLDPSGVVQGQAVPLRAPLIDFDEVEPSLVPFGNAVAVFWGRGSHIYICAGCVPDHRIDLILVDPRTLNPLSNLVSVTNAGTAKAGGLLRRAATTLGSSLLTTYNLTFHVHATPGSASFACDALPGGS
jgi:hypothetical protein